MFPFSYSWEDHGHIMETSWEYHGDILLVGEPLTRYREGLNLSLGKLLDGTLKLLYGREIYACLQ